jgi:ligand-binding sensor domain-containing protein
MERIRFIVVLTVTLVLNFSLRAMEKEAPEFINLGVEDGLSQSIVYSVLKDHQGFLWIGTNYGLNRYDGYEFDIFINNPHEQSSLSNNSVRDVLEDHQQNLWVATYGGGVNIFNRENNSFNSFKHIDTIHGSLSHDHVNALYQDLDSNLWVGTRNGLNLFTGKPNRFFHYFHDPYDALSISSNDIQCFEEDKDGNLWVGTWEGLNLFNARNNSFKRYLYGMKDSQQRGLTILTLFCDSRGNLWAGTRKNGLFRYSKNHDEFTPVKVFVNGKPENFTEKPILSLEEGYQGDIWIGTWDGGALRYDPHSGVAEHYDELTALESARINNKVWTIYNDGGGILWMGTHGGGLSRYESKRKKFIHIKKDEASVNGLNNNMVLSIYKDYLGYLWIGTYSGGLNRYDPESQTYKYYTYKPNDKNSLSSNKVSNIIEDVNNNLWIGTQITEDVGGLNKYLRDKDEFRVYRNDPDDPNSLHYDGILTLHCDTYNNLWIGTRGRGLDKLIIDHDRIIHYNHNEFSDNSLSSNFITDIVEDENEHLWIGTDNGLNKLNPFTESVEHFYFDPYDKNTLTSDYISTLCIGKDGKIWIGTDNGLNIYNPEQKSFASIYQEDGLSNNYIKSILEDDNGDIWVATNYGLNQVKNEGDTIIQFSEMEGLQSMEFNGAAHKDNDGWLYFGGVNGYNKIHPDSIRRNEQKPPVYITQLSIHSNKNDPGESGFPVIQNVLMKDTVFLNYRQKFLTFEYVALNYMTPEENQYAYLLEGLEDQWNYVGASRTATYTNLSPGIYRFHVKGANSDGVWNEKGKTLTIVISPPFWLTWWFKSLVIILLTLVLISLHRLRLQSVKKRKMFLEKEVIKRTAEIKIQNKKLEDKNEHLALQKQEIESQAEKIKDMYALLKEHNIRLRHDVKDISQARIMHKRVDFDEFKRIYPDDEACFRFLDELKWSEAYVCFKCSSTESKYTNLSRSNQAYARRCRKCKNIESATVGTIFFRIKFPIVKAFYILFLESTQNHISVDELSTILNLRRQTCYNFQKKVQQAVASSSGRRKNEDGWSHLILTEEWKKDYRRYMKKTSTKI